MSVGMVGLSLVASVTLSGCVIAAQSGHHYPSHHPQPVVVMKPYHYPQHHGHHHYPHHGGHHYGHHREHHRGHQHGHHH